MARVDRVLTMPGGSLLMAGSSGVGRRTAVSIVSHMHQMQVFSPKIGRGYTAKHFKNDLKTVSMRDQLGQIKPFLNFIYCLPKVQTICSKA